MQTKVKIQVLLFVLACFTSCHGQQTTRANNPGPAASEPGKTTNNQQQNTSPENGFRAAVTDKAGNIWLGTTGQGAYRYNGKSFTHFTTKNGLTSNTVYSISEDDAGNIWFGTDAGICRYDGKAFNYVPIPVNNGGNPAFVNPAFNKVTAKKISVVSIMQDQSGKLWFCTSAGVFCYDGKMLSPFLATHGPINKNKLNLNAAQSVLEDKAGNIWFATWFEGIVRYDGKELINFTPNNEVWFVSLLQDPQGNIWTSRRGKGLLRYNGTTFKNVLQRGVLDSCTAPAMLQDRQGNIWFTALHNNMARRETTGGLWRYNGKSFTNFTTKDGLPSNTVLSVTEDKAGNIWAGTRNMGLVRFDGKTFTGFSDLVK